MSSISPVELLSEWDFNTNQTPIEASTLPHRFELQSLRLLAQGEPVSAEMIAKKAWDSSRHSAIGFRSVSGKGAMG